ncbi:Glucose-6-phosphate 1-dehydrogenase [Candidatus Portiera aleyrodidarum]|uniref:glucose-6-phosphate dehydrogenase n=1 Tax=Candidatus Portiera aleyrodidarum TaxID=91844 RepID=UPI0005DA25EB|nr:glucose-6-phosphate dehydrogenase [Candidatus Portiera aleyrodidarum]CEL12461.1 Glucose-6-phosphate 1-dehydrogenase [Candidatus Portiera aleyrodidarum]
MKLNLEKITNLNFLLFGALGDLALRKLYHSLFILYKKKLINKKINILCLARKYLTLNKFRYKIYKILLNNKKIKNKNELILIINFIKCLYYLNIDFTNLIYYKLIKFWLLKNNFPLIFYLSVSSNLFKIICKNLNLNKCIKTNSKIILEKPIGFNLKSSININTYIKNIFYEKNIFRIDHYLGKRQVKNLLNLRFLNTIFYNLWNKKYITHIKIILAESLGIEDRWGYFDKTGQLRDMVQNHLIQILSIITICVPNKITYKNIRKEKIKLLKDLNNSFLTVDITYGQYISNKLHKKIFNGYLEEENSNRNSCTETFISIKTKINNFYWYGIPFYLISGKRLKKKLSQIIISFNKNKLIIKLQPKEEININILNKNLFKKLNYKNMSLVNKKTNYLDSYEFLILEVIKGKQDFFVSKEEIDFSWRWIDKISYIWKQKNIPIFYYKSFTWGPFY